MKEDIYITIKAFDCSLLERCVKKFIDELKRSGAKLSGPVALPRKDSKFIVNKSPHVDKKSREQFEMRVSKRLIIIHDPTSTMMQMLTGLSFSAGVEVELRVKTKRAV
ncbi:30S ribosomal protein S10 [Wolbachia pipientis]|uniref:Small ribosomal subunit protein uS10 n=1 Tax=Wolbachia pipientis TaxID=955 RepID=A0A1E7QKB5_WOLPI|nr:30S ribosomal protein S10 [Wolbachia pipientis]OEY86796.1 30S ribosomal protein S10 [Wolbachia pipientis]